MARKTVHERRDPVSEIPSDDRWYPAEVQPGQWQGHRKWIEREENAAHPCHCATNDVEGEEAIQFGTRDECQGRCDELNAKLDAE